MIFAKANHIELIKQGVKTQTRRQSGKYRVGHLYSIQPCRTCKGIPDGKIRITEKYAEWFPHPISHKDAQAEGEYTPREYEQLYQQMYPDWGIRYVYMFRFIPNSEGVIP